MTKLKGRLHVVVGHTGNREIRQRRSSAFHRMPVDLTAFDAALDDAVADAGMSQLHDHVGASGEQADARHGLAE